MSFVELDERQVARGDRGQRAPAFDGASAARLRHTVETARTQRFERRAATLRRVGREAHRGELLFERALQLAMLRVATAPIDALMVAAIACAGLRRTRLTRLRASCTVYAAHSVARRIVADVVHRDLRRGNIAACA
jgi:hypothetical protein